jgi:hypothetical protein
MIQDAPWAAYLADDPVSSRSAGASSASGVIRERWPRRPSSRQVVLRRGGHSRPACDDYPVTLTDLSRLASQLDGVSESRREGLLHWRYRGRLVARQLDDSHIVIRASFEFRDLLLQSFPETFSVPKRFAKHMMVVADCPHNPESRGPGWRRRPAAGARSGQRRA